jgi:hypothetical protein
MLCQECGFENQGSHSFCVHCGKSLTRNLNSAPMAEAKPSVPTVASGVTPVATSYTSGGGSKRPVAVVLIVFLVLGGGVALFGGYQLWKEARLERLAQESLSEAFGDEELENAVSNCGAIQDEVEDIPEQQIAAYAASLEGVSEPRDAYMTANQAEFPSQDYAPGYKRAVETTAKVGLNALYRESDRENIAPESQLIRWEKQWFDHALETCGARAQYEGNLSLLTESDREFDRIRTMAANAPWYPEEFSEFSENLAYRWSTSEGGWPCNSCSFWKITVITKTGCPSGLYGEINILQGGVVVDWTNDLISYLGSGDTAQLTFTRYPYRSNFQGQLTELSCY